MSVKRMLLAILFGLGLSVNGNAQVHDYNWDPEYGFQFEHLQLTLELLPDSEVIRGVAGWTVVAVQDSIPEIELLATRTDVHSVLVNERVVEHTARGDTLVISLSRLLSAGQKIKLEIVYESDACFALNRRKSGAYWSSLNPGASANLLPLVPSPSVQVTTDIRIIVPNTWQAVANGLRRANTLLPENRRLYHWRSDIPVPVTDIAVFAGVLESTLTEVDGMQLRIYHEAGALDESESLLLNQSLEQLTSAAVSFLGKKLPYGGINIIYLHDHRWQVRNSAAGLAYVFGNGGDFSRQLSRAIAHQYFGAYHRSVYDGESDIFIAAQGIIYAHIRNNAGVVFTDNDMTEYPEWSGTDWKKISPFSWEDATTVASDLKRRSSDRLIPEQMRPWRTLSEMLKPILALPAGTYTWSDYLSKTNKSEDLPEPRLFTPDPPEIEHYVVHYIFDEENGRYELEIVPQGAYPSRYLTLTIRQFSNGTVNDREMLISNEGDRLHLSTSGYVENMYILNDDPLLHFKENKPARFWLYQLRRDSDSARRIESARGFGRVQDDPDVQLILQDLIRNEPDDDVKAILVSSLSQVVGGSFGTNQRFIELLRNESRKVRFAALDALRNYPGNEAVQRQVFQIISQSQDIEYVNKAISVYKDLVDEQEFYLVARGLLQDDVEDLYFTATVIPLLTQTERGRAWAGNLRSYLEPDFPFSLRYLVFREMTQADVDVRHWQEVLPKLLGDSDPRIRYIALENASYLETEKASELLEYRLYNEYDVRVLERVRRSIARD